MCICFIYEIYWEYSVIQHFGLIILARTLWANHHYKDCSKFIAANGVEFIVLLTWLPHLPVTLCVKHGILSRSNVAGVRHVQSHASLAFVVTCRVC